MTAIDASQIASQLTDGERGALLSLPVRDRGDLPDDIWWAYYSIRDAGLSTSDNDFLMVATPLGEAVRAAILQA